MENREYIGELMVQVRQIADGQIRIEGKLDVMTNDYNSKIDAQHIRTCTLEERVKNIEEQNKWLERTIIGQVITIIIGVIVYVLSISK